MFGIGTRSGPGKSSWSASADPTLAASCSRPAIVARTARSLTSRISVSRVEWRGQILSYCVSRDFSRRKQVEQALHESEERFRVLVEQAADAFFVLDKKGRFVDVNHMACEILGYSRPNCWGWAWSTCSKSSTRRVSRSYFPG